MTYKKKLIEVALPLEAINKASTREKSIRHGHPSTLHLWWARRPLAAARAVIFAQMVDDPSAHPDLFKTEKAQEKERQRLFRIVEDLVKWENTTNETVLQQARDEIWQSWRYTCAENAGGGRASRPSDASWQEKTDGRDARPPADHPRAKELFDRYKLPAFHDPFAGGGALPLEAQRLGLESYASDLNPVAVLINKAMIEIPPRFAGRPPVHPPSPSGRGAGGEGLFKREWKGAQGLAEDVRYYGQWMRDEAERRIGHLYPKVEVTEAMVQDPSNPRPDLKQYLGRKLAVIAWLWARTVKSPNPAFADVDVPLASTFMLSTKAGKEAYVEPVILGGRASCPHEGEEAGGTPAPLGYRFTVKVGKPKDVKAAKKGTKLARGANFKCLMSGTPMTGDHIKGEGKAGRMSARLMAIVAEGERGRVYLAPTPEMEAIALTAQPTWKPETPLPADMRSHWTPPYGLTTYGDLFTPRQLVALTTFSDLVQEARAKVKADALTILGAGVPPAEAPGWYRRGDKHPPHYDTPNLTQFVTFRLADTLPQEKLRQWKDDLAAQRISDAQYRQQAEEWLDQGLGACWLRHPPIATLVRDALLHFDGTRYFLHGWVIMPNHVHVVFSPCEPHRLADILHTWKSYTAKKANRILVRSGPFWQDDYFDRFMRDESDLNDTLTYLAYNPVVAGLSATPEQYPFAGVGGRASRPSATREQGDNDGWNPFAEGQASGLSDFARLGENDGRDARPPSPGDDRALDEGGTGATAYADAVGVYLGIALSRLTDICNALCRWGPTSLPLKLDRELPNLGKFSACRRVARTIYMGSAPTTAAAHLGLEDRRVKLGCVMPGESPAVFGDALRRMAGAATYLYQDGPHYWYSTQPTVTKLAEDRAEQLKREPDKVVAELEKRLRKDLARTGDFNRIHPMPQSGADVPDDPDARLVVLGVAHPYSKEGGSPAELAAKAILETRGNTPRLYRNTLVFLAADKTRLQDLDEAARKFLAWESILAEQKNLNLSPYQVTQAETQRTAAESAVTARLPETYQWLLVPGQTTPQAAITWEALRLSGTDALAIRAGKKLRTDELYLTSFAPTRLRMELDRVPLWRGDHVAAKQLVEDFARYLYLPRLKDPTVLLHAIGDGVNLLLWSQDSFGFADSFDEVAGRYKGLRGGQIAILTDAHAPGLVVKPDVASRQMDAERAAPPSGGSPGTPPWDGTGTRPTPPGVTRPGQPQPAAAKPKRFHGTAVLDTTRVGRDASRIADEVISHLAGLVGATVTVTIEVEAEIPSGAPDQVVRTVTENSRTLKFTSHGFEKE